MVGASFAEALADDGNDAMLAAMANIPVASGEG